MANNRMYLRCAECKRVLFLGKRFGTGYYWHNYGYENNAAHKDDPGWRPQDDRPLEDRLNAFFEEHEWCGDSLDHFDIVYEDDDDFMEKVKWSSE